MLSLDQNTIESLVPMSNMIDLIELDLSFNKISDLKPIKNLKKILFSFLIFVSKNREN
jgi:Leucine-rich repeat (LRR) protein